MPKLLENVRADLLLEARRQLAERGYSRMTIRSVAEACGVAVGTVYNYFPSKEMLVATFMAESWRDSFSGVEAAAPENAEAYLRGLYDALTAFMKRYGALFADAEAEKAFTAVFPARHRMLREQLAALAAPVCGDGSGAADFPARFVAEALLTWAVEDVPFETLWPLLAGALATNHFCSEECKHEQL